jgi:predicted transglutaminase-like cysteine proteinase
MARWLAGVVAVFGSLAARADEPLAPPKSQGQLVQEVWQAASIGGERAGYFHFTVQEMQSPSGVKFLRASRTLSLTLKRFGDVARIDAVIGNDETPDGKVLGVFMKQGLGKQFDLVVRGVVKNDQVLHVTAAGKMQFERDVPWDPSAVGAYGELRQVAIRQPQPGTQFSYVIFEPIINALVKVQAKADGYEDVTVGGQKYRLLKLTAQPEKVAGIQLPASTFWFDARYDLIRTETTMPGLGQLLMERTSQADAVRPCVGPDLGWKQSIALKQRLAASHDGAAAVYRIKVKDDDPATVFTADERQTVKALADGAIQLEVQAVRQPPETLAPGAAAPGPEFLKANNFLNSDDSLVKQHAAAAVGAETDPWRKALRIESWVHRSMKVMNFTEAMAPAGEVARTLEGDCTEYSMLAAAMCRAVGVPSRTALGLVYVDARDGRDPMLAMHMWTEVWVNGKWVGLDATLGRGSVGPGHIKVTDHSWHQVATMTPLMPLLRVMMGQPAVEIVSEQRNRT